MLLVAINLHYLFLFWKPHLFIIDFRIRSGQSGRTRHLKQDLIINHLIQYLKLQILCFLRRSRLLFSACEPTLELLLELRRSDIDIVDTSHDVGRR